MSNPAVKLGHIDVSSINRNLKVLEVRNEYGIYKDDKGFVGLRYYEIDENSKNQLLKVFIPSELRDKFYVSVMFINYDDILPHTDSGCETVINYYLKASEAVTHFWRLNTDSYTESKLENQTDGSIYNKDDLECIFSFKAKNKEYWILNVKEIHSVSGATANRIAYSFQTKMPYNEVLKYFS